MNIAYLQCDARYNKWLLKKMSEKGATKVIECTVDRIKELTCEKIVAGIYKCKENETLIDALKENGVHVEVSEEDDVNSRFINLVIKEKADFVVRVGGDQVLMDAGKTNEILREMQKHKCEWFMEEASTGILPDIVSIGCLQKYKEQLLQEDRYFFGLKKEKSVKRYKLPHPYIVLYDFRVSSNEQYRICKNVIENEWDVYEMSARLAQILRNKNNYLNKTGIWGSWILPSTEENFFFDEEKKVNPWWGRSAIEFVENRLSEEWRGFEWGAGNSTLFWSTRVKEVTSVEYDLNWYVKMKKVVPANVNLKYYELVYDGDYCKAILNERDKYDIILIDGRDRVRCARSAVEKLQENGIIIWDNTERDYYQEGYDYLKGIGFKRLELSSIFYGVPGEVDSTSIFYREKNILGL